MLTGSIGEIHSAAAEDVIQMGYSQTPKSSYRSLICLATSGSSASLSISNKLTVTLLHN